MSDDIKTDESYGSSGKSSSGSRGGADDENLWTSFLSSQAGLSFKEGHLIVCGSPGSGKTSLVRFFGRMEGDSFGEMKKFLMLRYSYVMLEDGQALLNVMQISHPSHLSVLTETIPEDHMDRVAYMIVLSAAEPSGIEAEWKAWTEGIAKQQQIMLDRLSESKRSQLTDKIYDHVQYYVNPTDTEALPATEEEKESLGLTREQPKQNIGAPLIAVITQVDAMKGLYAADALANRFYDILVQYVRLWCLDYGAASFSMAAGLAEQARRILSYVQHRIFDTKFIRFPSAVVSVTNLKDEFLFIPSGFDSESLIEKQAAGRSLEEPFSTHFKSDAETTATTRKKFKATAEGDVEFLKRMLFDLNQASESSGRGVDEEVARDEVVESTSVSGAPKTASAADVAAGGAGRSTETQAVQKLMRTLLNTQP